MIFGVTATSLTFVSLIICIISYIATRFNKDQNFLRFARWAFYFASLLILIQSVLLMWGIMTHQFQWQYVFSYTSTDLSDFYLITTFWGGQEGTFLLWLLLGSIYGIIIIRKRDKDESNVMIFMALILAFIAMILIKKNPFSYVWEVRPHQFQPGEVPLDGNGLNPLLQDPWMIIHPPVLFTGYSSTMILFAYAMSTLINRDYTAWVKRVYPFSLFVGLSLGTGIILGGYWAYTTLGWGGYWAWDPVENSSFIPWLSSLALIHGIIIQKRQGGLQRTNIFLALLTFILVLYGSFLTRSGVLSDFSVHSFSQSEINDYLVGFLALFIALAILFFVLRKPQDKSVRISSYFFTRENFMFFGLLTLLLSSVLTFFGTSAPLFSGLFLGQAANVSIEYYNLLNTPLAILLGFFIAISPILSWKKKNEQGLQKFRLHLVLAAAITAGCYFIGIRNIIHLVLIFIFIFAVLVNAEIVYKMIRMRNWGFGGYLSHVGIGLMLMGIVASSAYETSVKTTLPLNISKKVLEYDVMYLGFRTGTDGKDEAVIKLSDNLNREIEASPKFFWSEYNQAYMRNPSVHNLWTKDVYISPIQVIPPEENDPGSKIEIEKGGQVYFEDFIIRFTGYEMDEHSQTNDRIKISAVLNIAKNGENHIIKPALLLARGEQVYVSADIPGTRRTISIDNISVEDKKLTLRISDEKLLQAGAGVELLAVEITEKPMINLLWMGTVIMIAGLVITLFYRIRISRL
jgi:cytochrome c-type biogenesis protein CcmF